MTSTHPAATRTRRKVWTAMVFVAFAFVTGITLSGLSGVSARAPEESSPLCYKFGKNYINFDKITHVIDEPGFNMPPGSLQVYFDGNQNWLALYGDEADAFRQAIAQVTTDLTPKKAETEKTEQAKPGTEKTKRRAIVAPGAKAGTGSGAAPAPKSNAPVKQTADEGF